METIKYDELDFDPIKKLLQAIHYDPVINQKVKSILKMDAYPRRLVLNNWLEQLNRNNAPQDFLSALSFLFDDNVAEQILMFIYEHS